MALGGNKGPWGVMKGDELGGRGRHGPVRPSNRGAWEVEREGCTHGDCAYRVSLSHIHGTQNTRKKTHGRLERKGKGNWREKLGYDKI